MRIQIEQFEPSVIVIELDGRFDAAGAAEAGAAMDAAAAVNPGVVVDLAKVSFMASMGLRCLLQASKIVQRRGGRLVLLNPGPDVKQVLDVTGMAQLMTVCNDRDQALAAVSQSKVR